MSGENEGNDLLADLLDDEIKAEAGEVDAPNAEELNILKSQVEELTSANAGLLKAKQAETRKRQDSSDRLNQLEGAVGTILSQRQQQGTASISEAEAAGARAQGIPVRYDDDGNGWIDQSAINTLVSPYEQRINDLETRLQQTDANVNASSNAEKVMDGIIGENERFGPASGRYRAARKWVEDQVFDFTQANGVNRVLSSSEALTHVFDEHVSNEFSKQFEGLNLLDIVTAEDSEQHFRRMLNSVADATPNKDDTILPTPKEKMDSRFQKVLDKPSTLGNQANAKAGQSSIMEKVGSLSTQDILDLGEEQIDTLMKLMGQE
jgi:hypothetical protein